MKSLSPHLFYFTFDKTLRLQYSDVLSGLCATTVTAYCYTVVLMWIFLSLLLFITPKRQYIVDIHTQEMHNTGKTKLKTIHIRAFKFTQATFYFLDGNGKTLSDNVHFEPKKTAPFLFVA